VAWPPPLPKRWLPPPRRDQQVERATAFAPPSLPPWPNPEPVAAVARRREPDSWPRPEPLLPPLPAKPSAPEPRLQPAGSVSRAVGFAAASAVVPGLGQALQRRWRAAVLIGVPTVVVLLAIAWALAQDPLTLISWVVDPELLRALAVGGLLWGAFCALAAVDAGRTAWPARGARPHARVLSGVLVATVAFVALVPGIAVTFVAMRQDHVLDTVFAGSDGGVVAVPSPLSDLGVTTTVEPPRARQSTTASPPTATVPVTTAPVTLPPGTLPAVVTAPTTTAPAEVGRWNIALLGGDAGPRRWGLRTDTMIVVSIDRATGDLTGISVPRNLRRLPMPPGPLRDRFPSGFNDLANALYPYVETHPELGIDASQAVKGALAELLGIPIDHYVLVDMAGFVRIIDALGGVTVELSRNVPLVPNIDGVTKEAPSVGPGPVRMNGAMALAFSRTRKIDSDYGRMQRQRCLLASVARGTSATTLAQNYLTLTSAVEGAFRSDIPRDRLGELVRLFGKVDVAQARTLLLVPPVIRPGHPDIAQIRGLVARALDAAGAATEPAISAPTC
jgi:LCP family protein required for cell wall assembly